MLLQLLLYPSVSIFGSGAAVGAFGASVANYAAKSSLDAAYIQHDCDDIPFDEIKEVLDVRFSKVDKDLDVSSSTLKLISQMVGENTSIIEETRAAVYKGFDNVLNSIKNSRTGPTISKLDNFIQYFMSEKKVIMNLPHDQYIAKVEEQNGVLFNLRDSRTTKADSLNTLLYDIINQKYAIPEDLNDKAAFYALYSLYYGTQSYVSVMYFLLEQYSYLADYHYQNGDMKEYNKYFDLTQIIFRDFQHSLIGVTSNGISLIDNVVNVFNEVKNKKFIKSKEDLFDLLSQRIESLTDVKFRLQGMKLPMIVDVPGKLIGRPTFTESIVTTPIGKWEDGAKVSYAVQYKYNDTRSKVGEWSDQLTINGKANPLLKVPVDSKRRTRLIFRKFNDDKPQLVGVLESRYQTDFKDLDRDLYNAASRFDENVAMREIGILIRNGANINAAFDKERRAIHAAAQSGNIQLVQDVLLRNNATDINVKDSDGYTPMHIAAQVGNEGFIDLLIGRGADVNAKTSLRKLTPLHIAAYKGYVSAVEILMKSDGIDVNAREKEDFSPLHSAVIGGVPVVQALLSNSDVDVNARSHDGLTPLHLSSIHNYLDVAEALLEGNEVDINAMANGNLTALHLASLIGNLEMVKFLAARNGIDVNKKSIEGWVPLHFAVAFKNGNVVAELLNINSINVNAVGKDNIIPLHLAAITGQKSIVLSLLEKGVKIDEKTKDGLTALHLATANDKREVIFTLIDRGAKIDEKTVDGFTPLHFATQNGYLELVKYFVDEKGVDFHITDNSRRTPLQVTDQLEIVKYFIEEKKASYEHCIFDVVERGRLNILSYLIAKGADINKQGSFGNTLLHIAILGGNLDIVKCLIEKKADVNIKNNEDRTPLYVAAKYGRLDIVKYLAENGANINEKNELSNTPLYIAIEHGHLAIVKYLTKKGGYVSEKENVDITPLYVATEFNHLDIVEYLVNEGANINEKDKWGNTPLHVAAEFGRLDMVEYFIEKGASIDEQNETGGTPLYVAVVNNRLNIVKCLIKKGADINVKNSEDHTPMYMAAKLGRLDIVRYFIEEVSSVNQQNEWGSTSLHAAIVNNRLNIVKYFIEERGEDVNKQNRVGITPLYVAATHNRLDIVKYFIVKGANVNIKNSEGHTPLYTAAKFGHLNIVKCLIEEKADVNVKDSNDHTSLHIAAQIGRLDIVEYLIEKKADVNVKDSNGHTPLHIAAKFGRLNVVEYLTKEGASVDIKDNNGHTPLDIANKFGHSDIVEYLKSKGTSRSRRSIESKELPKEIESSSYDYNTFVSDDLLESNKIEYNRENNNQAASGASKPSSWINDSFGWVKSSVGELLSSKPEGNTSSISQVNTQIDVNSTITLLNVLIRKVTGQQRFISSVDQSISPLEAQDCALNIIEEFEKVVNQAALKNGISMHRLNIDYVEMKKEVTAKIMSGKFNDIPEILNSYVEKACPGIEAGCPDKLSSKKFDKFMVEFNKRLDIALAQQQILNNSVSTLEVNNIKEQQINLEPQSYLSNTSIQGHLTQDKAKLVS